MITSELPLHFHLSALDFLLFTDFTFSSLSHFSLQISDAKSARLRSVNLCMKAVRRFRLVRPLHLSIPLRNWPELNEGAPMSRLFAIALFGVAFAGLPMLTGCDKDTSSS